jgi:predicted DNA-binding WGR domain protein
MMETLYALYRFNHPDGSAKEWAIALAPQDNAIEVRFGKEGNLVQRHLMKTSDPNSEYQKRISEKTGKGYVLVGQYGIDPSGRPFVPSDEVKHAQKSDNISWEFRTRKDVTGQMALVQKALFDLARLLEVYGLAVMESQSVVIGSWKLGFSSESMPPINEISLTTGEGAGFVNRDDGPWPLLLLLAFKRQLPTLCSLTVANPDGIEVSDQLKLEKDVLRLLDSDLERVRPIAEALDLMPPKIDLNQVSPGSPNYYF